MKILVAVDLGDTTEQVVVKALALALASDASLWLLHVAEPEPAFLGYKAGPQSVRDSVAARFHDEHRRLQAIATEIRERGVDAHALLIQGATVETINQQADSLEVDLLVAGTHGHSVLRDLLLGSVSEGLVRTSEIPILVVPIRHR